MNHTSFDQKTSESITETARRAMEELEDMLKQQHAFELAQAFARGHDAGWQSAMAHVATQNHLLDEVQLNHDLKETLAFNKRIRDNVDLLLSYAGFDEESSARNQLSCMNFDVQQTKHLSNDVIDKIVMSQFGEMKGYPLEELRKFARTIEITIK